MIGPVVVVLKTFKSVVLILFLFSFSFGFAQTTVSIMSYNVENLFDATDDGDEQGDPAFLPLAVKQLWPTDRCQGINGHFGRLCRELDWLPEKYEARLEQLSHVLLSYADIGADIIVLHEIENRRVMHDLWELYLKEYDYLEPFHFESPSSRGIDVGVISRLKLAEPPIAHKVDLDDLGQTTRDIIEATYETPHGTLIRIAGNHWPSPGNDGETRLRAADVLREMAYDALDDGVSFVAVGDFNTLLQENPNPISGYLTDHDLYGWEIPLIDLQDYLGGFSTFPHNGSHFFKNKWDPLDRILVSKDIMLESWDFSLEENSFDIFFLDEMMTRFDPVTGKELPFDIPFRHDFFSGEGYSDHLPIVVKLIEL